MVVWRGGGAFDRQAYRAAIDRPATGSSDEGSFSGGVLHEPGSKTVPDTQPHKITCVFGCFRRVISL